MTLTAMARATGWQMTAEVSSNTSILIRWRGPRQNWRMAKLSKSGFPKEHKVKLFRVEVFKNRTDWIATNDLAQNLLNTTQDACGIFWKIEQPHRKFKN